MPDRRAALDQLHLSLGDDSYHALVASVGGEDELWEQWQKMNAPLPASSSASSSSANSASTGEKIIFWLALVLSLLFGLGVYLGNGLDKAVEAFISFLFFLYYLFRAVLFVFRHLGQVLGTAAVLGTAGLLLYALFKAGVFFASSTQSFFEWLFGHLF